MEGRIPAYGSSRQSPATPPSGEIARRRVEWPSREEVERVAAGMRRRTLEVVVRRQGGYLIQTCSSAEILATVCLALVATGHDADAAGLPMARRHGPGSVYLNAGGGDDNRLIVSPGHYALALYTALVELGRLPERELAGYGAPDSVLELIGADYSPGFEIVGGSLGQGLSQAVGIAMGRRFHGDAGRVFVLLSDGEMQEGQTWEAVQSARHHVVAGLNIIVDANGQQVDGDLAAVMDIERLEDRFSAFGADVATVDGHDVAELIDALSREAETGPAVTIARTNPAQGMPAVIPLVPGRRHGLWFSGDAELEPFATALGSIQAGGHDG
jgi:transketolase